MFYFAIVILLLSPFLLNINLSYFGSFVILIAVLLLFIENRFNRNIRLNKQNIFLGLFVLGLLLFLPFSLLPSKSLYFIVWFFGYIGIFIYCQNLVNKGYMLVYISKIFIILTTIFGIFSLSRFIDIGLTVYTRLEGIIGNHNVYGGFLIIPLLLSLYFLFNEFYGWRRYLWSLTSSILFTSIILTFSRGTWLSIVLAIIISSVLFWRIGEFKQVKQDRKLLKPVLAVFFTTFIMFCGVWYMAKQTTINTNPNDIEKIALYPQQDQDNNAVVARLHYFQDAWHTFIKSPIVGFGPGLYANALRMFKLDPSFNSFADPHNWFLKMLVENGILITAIFLAFLFSLFYKIALLIKKNKDDYWLTVFIFTGLLGSVIHGLMDFDWSNYFILSIFFIFASSLYGYLINKEEQESGHAGKSFPLWINYVFLAMIIIAAIASIQLLRADLARVRGDVQYLNFKDNNSAINSYFESITYNSHDPLTWYNLWRVYYFMNKFEVAKSCIEKAIEIFPENGIYWGALARTQEMFGEYQGYRESLLKAIEYFPASDLNYYVKLVKYDIETGKYDEALYFVNKIIPIYSKYEKSLWYKNDPNSSVISENLAILRSYQKKILGDLAI